MKEMVEAFVTEVLNGLSEDGVLRLFSPAFRDHDPLVIPGMFEKPASGKASREDIRALVRFLGLAAVDIRFTLEDAFECDDRCAFRIFGQGSLRVVLAEENPDIRPSIENPFILQGKRESIEEISDAPLIGDHLLVQYCCTGMLRSRGKAFTEKWGVARFAW